MTTGEQQGAFFSLDIPVGLYGANAEQKTLPQLFQGLMLSGEEAKVLDSDALAKFLFCFCCADRIKPISPCVTFFQGNI